MSIALIREHYDYHRWANRRLFDLAAGLGDGVTRDMGAHWSFPTLKGMFAHIYGADNVWLTRWKGSSPNRLLGDADFASMADLRARWDALEAEQRAFVAGLAEADLTRPVGTGTPRARSSRSPSGLCSSTWSTTRPTIGARPRP